MKRPTQESGIIWLLYVVIILAYYMVVQHYWFLKLTGGYLIKIWIPNVVIILAIFMKYEVIDSGGKSPFMFKRDYAYPLYVILLILGVWNLISLFSHDEGLWYVGKYALVTFSPVCVWASIVILIRKNSLIYRVLALIFLFGLINAVQVEIESILGYDSFESLKLSTGQTIEAGSGSPLSLVHSADLLRHGKKALGVNTYASWLMVLPLVGYVLGRRSSRMYLKAYYYVSSLFISYAIVATMTRGAFIGLIVGILIFSWFMARARSKTKALSFFVVAAFSLVILMHHNPGLTIRIYRLAISLPILSEVPYFKERLIDYGVHPDLVANAAEFDDQHFKRTGPSYDLLRQNMLFGAGWKMQFSVNEHNWYLRHAVVYGGISFLLLLIFFGTMVSRIWKVLKRELRNGSSDDSLGILMFSCVIASLVYLMVTPSEIMNFWILFGLAIAWARNAFERQKERAIFREYRHERTRMNNKLQDVSPRQTT